MTRVMVVESDADFAQQMRGALQQRWPGTAVQITADGQSALQSAAADPPDLILLCVDLPKVSGFLICNKLKKNPQLKDIPLVITSSDATQEIFEQHSKLRTRAEEYLIKPFEIEDLLAKIEVLVTFDGQDVGGLNDTMADGAAAIDVVGGRDTDGEFVVEDSDDEDEFPFAMRPGQGMAGEGDPTHVVDREIEAATDAAFAALSIDDAEHFTVPAAEGLAGGAVQPGESIIDRPDEQPDEATSEPRLGLVPAEVELEQGHPPVFEESDPVADDELIEPPTVAGASLPVGELLDGGALSRASINRARAIANGFAGSSRRTKTCSRGCAKPSSGSAELAKPRAVDFHEIANC